MNINQSDRDSPLWRQLTEYYADRLDKLRHENDASITPEQTNHLRGRIAEVIQFLGIEKDRPTVL